jgi:hypothetical protein
MIDLKVNKNDINNNSSPSYEKNNFNAKTYNKNSSYDELCETENINTNNDVPEIIMKDSKYFKNKIMDILKKLSIVFFILCYVLYFMSCEKCYDGEDVCSSKVSWIFTKIKEELISCIIMSILLQFILFKKISKIHLIHIPIVFTIFYFYSHDVFYYDHGYYNLLFYFIIVGLLTLFLTPINLILICFKKRKKTKKRKLFILTYLLIILFIFVFYLILFTVVPSNCKDWDKGLNNTYLDNNSTKYGCQIYTPKKCGVNTDLTKIKGKNCKTYKMTGSRQQLLKGSKSPYVNHNSKRIGYPLTNKDQICLKDFLDVDNLIQKYFYKNLVDMDNKEVLEKHYKDRMPEVEVDFTKSKQGEMKIHIDFNKTLSEERKALENKLNPYSKNILFLYIDSVSRVSSIKKLKKTLQFFEKFMPYEGGHHENYPDENFHSFQFFKYHSFRGYTSNNYPLIFYGQKKDSENITLITKHLKENGYITSSAYDFCDKDNTRTHHDLTFDEIFDHQFLLCDPNNEYISLTTIRCLYGKQNIEQLYDYTEQFWRKYPNNRKYSLIISNYGHEGTSNVIKYSDDIIYNFLIRLFNDNLLKDTTVILISDHGTSMPSLNYIYDYYTKEIDLPMLYFLINDRKNVSYEEQYKNIHENQQTFITAYDIYNTMGNILHGDNYINIKNKTQSVDTTKSEHGISLFSVIDQMSRTPQKYSSLGFISDKVCK